MNVAILLLVYKNSDLVEKFVRSYQHENICFFIHIDKKSDLSNFKYLERKYENVELIDERVDVTWGGWSMVSATILLLKTALKCQKKFNYFQLASDSCFPIKSADAYLDFLNTNSANNTNYITIHQRLDKKNIFQGRITKYYFSDYTRFYSNVNYAITQADSRKIPTTWWKRHKRKLVHRVQQGINKVLNRKWPFEETPYRGWQWWCLNRKAVEHVLCFMEQNKKFVRFFRYSHIPDETFFHTIIMNSKLGPHVSPKPFSKSNLAGMHDILWKHDRPVVVDESNLEHIKQSEGFFFRKVCPIKSYKFVRYAEGDMVEGGGRETE